MLKSISYFGRIIVVLLLLFFFGRLFFILVNYESLNDIIELGRITVNGLRLDLSTIGYFSIVPMLLVILYRFLPRISKKLLTWYWSFAGFFIILTFAVDPYFYLYWGQKTNLGFTQFLGKENAGLASIDIATYVLSIGFLVLMYTAFIRCGKRLLYSPKRVSVVGTITVLILAAVFIRGSLDKVPINVSSAYYSKVHKYNMTAVNTAWNFLAAELERDKHSALSFFKSDSEAQALLDSMATDSSLNLDALLKPYSKTNVVLIVLESFSAKTVGFLGPHEYAATPSLDTWMNKGIAYKKAYASSFRSDKGLLALTTGVPSGARQTLTNFPELIAKGPNVFKMYDTHHSSFYYGGNLEFANIKVLFNDADKVVSQSNFNSKEANTWGVHDHVVFDRFYTDFENETKPQFKMLFSLSSHEPFDVPDFNKLESPYLNSVAYTDSCLGVLMSKLSKSNKWENTLVIITADHGTIRPDNAPVFAETNFHIPLLLTGGVVLRDTVISAVVSQRDIPATLAKYKTANADFRSETLLRPKNHAFYSYYNGITYVTSDTVQFWDINMDRYLYKPSFRPYEKAFYQLENSAFFSR